MFLLHKKLETELDLDSEIYRVNMSFDNILTFFDIMEDTISTDYEKVVAGLYQLLGTHLNLEPDELYEVFKYMMEHFINEGSGSEITVDLEGNPMPIKKKEPVQDLKHDAAYIYASFKQAYNINLFEEQGKLDWREFKALLGGLPEDTVMSKIIDIRKRPYPKGKYATEERKRLKEAKRAYALPGVEIE